jgi:hypothetical protein
VDVDATFPQYRHAEESEIAMPGGVAPERIRGAVLADPDEDYRHEQHATDVARAGDSSMPAASRR